MYDALDPFLQFDSWHSGLAPDRERFSKALNSIVGLPGFDADDMGAFISERFNLDALPKRHPHSLAKDRLVSQAEAARAYLNRTKGI